MSRWQEIVIPKPPEKTKQKLPFKQLFNEYGFDYEAFTYTIPEEIRDFRKHIQNEIVMEHVRTQNVLGNHITGETDRNIENTDARAREIKAKIDNHHNYVINTMKSEIDEIKSDTETIKETQSNHGSLLAQILDIIR